MKKNGGHVPTLKGMTWDHPRGYDPLVATAARFRETHPDVELAWDRRSLQDFEHYPVDVLARSYDLIIIDHPHVGEVARDGVLLPFDEAASGVDLADPARNSVGPSFESYRWDGRLWALPVDAATQVQAYRPDRVARAAATWDEAVELASDGRVLLPLRPPHALMCVMTLAANLGEPPGQEPDRFLPDAVAARVLDELMRMRRLVPDACLAMDPIDALEALAVADHAALVPLTYGYVSYAREGFRPHRLAFADIPVIGQHGPRGSALGGTGLAVSAQTRYPAEAVAFAAFAASGDIQRTTYAESGGQPAHRAAWLDPRVNADASNFYRDTLRSHDLAYLRPRHAGYIGFQKAASEVLATFLDGRLDAGRAAARLDAAFAASFRPSPTFPDR